MSDPFSMENVAAMAGLPQQGHNIVIEGIVSGGVAAHLECVGHPDEGCAAQTAYRNDRYGEYTYVTNLNIRLPVAFQPIDDEGGLFTNL